MLVHVSQTYGDVAQLGERGVRNAEARGSIPLISTKTRSNTIQRHPKPTRNSGFFVAIRQRRVMRIKGPCLLNMSLFDESMSVGDYISKCDLHTRHHHRLNLLFNSLVRLFISGLFKKYEQIKKVAAPAIIVVKR